MIVDVAVAILAGARIVVAGAFVVAAAIALTHWGIRRGSVNAFGGWASLIRRIGDPLLRPIEQRLVRAGANPQDAPMWLIGVTVVGGLVLIGLVQWLVDFVYTFYVNARAGFALPIVVHTIFELLKIAIIIRVIASWFSISPYSKAMRVIHLLTDWLIDPIRRVLPSIGMFDFSPLAAYFLLYLAEQLIMRGLFSS